LKSIIRKKAIGLLPKISHYITCNGMTEDQLNYLFMFVGV